MQVTTDEFEVIKAAAVSDERGRITLGQKAAKRQYRVSMNKIGEVLLTPVVTIPAREAWLYQNEEALEMVRRGLEEAANGRLNDLGSFAEFANAGGDD